MNFFKKLFKGKADAKSHGQKPTVHLFAETYYDRAVFTKVVAIPEGGALVTARAEFDIVEAESENIAFTANVFVSALKKFIVDAMVPKDAEVHLILSETHLADSFCYVYPEGDVPEDVSVAAMAELEMRICGTNYVNQEIIYNERHWPVPGKKAVRGFVRYAKESIVDVLQKGFMEAELSIKDVLVDADCLLRFLEEHPRREVPGLLSVFIHASNYGCIFAGVCGNTSLTFPVKYGLAFYTTQGDQQFGVDLLEFMTNFLKHSSTEFTRATFVLSSKAKENRKIMDMIETYSSKDGEFTIIGSSKTRVENYGLSWMGGLPDSDGKELLCGAWKIVSRGGDRLAVCKPIAIENRNAKSPWWKKFFTNKGNE